jgi:hypothetical protein
MPATVEVTSDPIFVTLSGLTPLKVTMVAVKSPDARLLHQLLSSHHYLGFRANVGGTIGYLLRDRLGHPVALLETFVDRSRFRGTCYRAANWRCVGQTQGRSRQDRYSNMNVPIKDIYLYPLSPKFRQELKA